MERLPTLEKLEKSIQVENKVITDHQKIAKELEPLIKFIDFRRIEGKILAGIIEPLEIVSTEIMMNTYRHLAMKNNSDLNIIRGIPHTKFNDYVWDETACGSKLIIEDNGKVVQAPNDCSTHKSVRAKIIFDSKGIFEWDVIIEKTCTWAWVGVCAPEDLNYE